MPSATAIVIPAIIALILIPVSALVLWLATKLFKTPKAGFVLALKTAAVASAIMFAVKQGIGLALGAAVSPASLANPAAAISAGLTTLLILLVASLAVNTFSVKAFYKQKTLKAFLIGLVWLAIYVVVYAVIMVGIGAVVLATLAASYAA